MVKSTPINQLPQGQNKLETYITPKHETDFNNTQRAHDEFQQPVDTNNDITATNIDADISINEVMSEINNNKEIENAESNRLQQQINELQYQLAHQKQVNNVPQSPSACLVNDHLANVVKSEQLKPSDVLVDNSSLSESKSWYDTVMVFMNPSVLISRTDLKLFITSCVLFWLMSREGVNALLASKLSFISEDKTYLINIIRTLLFGILVLSLFKI